MIIHVIQPTIICLGVMGCIGIIGLSFFAFIREDKGRPFIPWGARMRVERAKAHTEILDQHLKQEALEIKRMALSDQRDNLLAAIAEGDSEQVQRLGLPSVAATNGQVEDASWLPHR